MDGPRVGRTDTPGNQTYRLSIELSSEPPSNTP